MPIIRTKLMRTAGGIGLLAMLLSFCLLRFESLGSNHLLISINFLLWISLTLLYPFASIRDGVVITEPGIWGYNKRDSGSAMFWANLIVMTFLIFLITIVVGVASYHAW